MWVVFIRDKDLHDMHICVTVKKRRAIAHLQNTIKGGKECLETIIADPLLISCGPAI